MSLDPSPVSSRPTPLLHPTDPAPGRAAALAGAAISTLIAGIVVFVSLHFATPIFFFAEGLKARAQVVSVVAPFRMQGYDLLWYKSFGGQGYQTPDITKVLQSENTDYHMNTVVISVGATVDQASPTVVNFDPTKGTDTYSDDIYTALVQQARAAGQTPIFKLMLHQTGVPDPWPGLIGAGWYGITGSQIDGKEQQWFDSYTAFAVHFAQLSQKLNMPFLIFAADLDHMTTDNSDMRKDAVQPGPGDTYTCQGRRDCEWRHVVAAIRNTTYQNYGDGGKHTGGGYTGKLIYAATNRANESITTTLQNFEWDPNYFLWWNAIDIIGIDAFFPLTTSATPSEATLQQAWQGNSTNAQLAANNGGNLINKLEALHVQTQLPILFTDAGYESIPGSNSTPGSTPNSDITNSDQILGQVEQANDMQALYDTFSPYSWWVGVIWYADYPIWPRSSLSNVITSATAITHFYAYTNQEPIWTTSTSWAGDCLTQCSSSEQPAKKVAQWLNSLPLTTIPTNP